ncbi:hypothetical protein D6D08_09929, partial [Aureobasidium pullulans]
MASGAAGILSSCLTTLTLCVWTAIHLNLPEQGKQHLQKYRKAGWLVLGLLAPEIVAWNAWEQYLKASRATRKFNDAYPKTPTPRWHRRVWLYCKERLGCCLPVDVTVDQEIALESASDAEDVRDSSKRHGWTLTHGFYATMGGFAIQTEQLKLGYPPNVQTLVIEEPGLLHILEHVPEILPDLPESDILDKSKANLLAKSIVCLQAFWFCIQCVARLSQGASISLLELNTLGHCLCTFVTYAIWWKKPADIDGPTFLPMSDKLRQHVALMDLYSRHEKTVPALAHRVISDHPRPNYGSRHEPHDERLYQKIMTRHSLGERLASRVYVIHQYWIKYILSPGLTLPTIFDLEPSMVERLDQAAKTCLVYNEDDSRFYGWSSTCRTKNWSLSSSLLRKVTFLREDQKGFRMTTISNAGPIWLVLTMVEAVYGGLHLLAWNASFSTVVERILWQISGITVTSLGPLCAIIGPLCTIIFISVARFDDHAFKIRYHLHFGRGGVFRTPVQLLSTAFIVCYAVLYLLAR